MNKKISYSVGLLGFIILAWGYNIYDTPLDVILRVTGMALIMAAIAYSFTGISAENREETQKR